MSRNRVPVGPIQRLDVASTYSIDVNLEADFNIGKDLTVGQNTFINGTTTIQKHTYIDESLSVGVDPTSSTEKVDICGNILIHRGDITSNEGDLTLQNGDITTISGNLILQNGYIDVSGGYLEMNHSEIKNVLDTSNSTSAVSKQYVDTEIDRKINYVFETDLCNNTYLTDTLHNGVKLFLDDSYNVMNVLQESIINDPNIQSRFDIHDVSINNIHNNHIKHITNNNTDTQIDSNLIVTDTNKVGIGYTNPSYTLDVCGNSRIQNMIIQEHSTGDFSIINSNLVSDISTNYAFRQDDDGDTFINSASTKDIYLRTNDNTKMIIRDSGRVGIGNNNPSYTLDVCGNFRLNNNDSSVIINDVGTKTTMEITNNNQTIELSTGDTPSIGTTTNHSLKIKTNNNDAIIIQDDGIIGIGVTNPSNTEGTTTVPDPSMILNTRGSVIISEPYISYGNDHTSRLYFNNGKYNTSYIGHTSRMTDSIGNYEGGLDFYARYGDSSTGDHWRHVMTAGMYGNTQRVGIGRDDPRQTLDVVGVGYFRKGVISVQVPQYITGGSDFTIIRSEGNISGRGSGLYGNRKSAGNHMLKLRTYYAANNFDALVLNNDGKAESKSISSDDLDNYIINPNVTETQWNSYMGSRTGAKKYNMRVKGEGRYACLELLNTVPNGATMIDFSTRIIYSESSWQNPAFSDSVGNVAPITSGRIIVKSETNNNYEDSRMEFYTCRDRHMDGIGTKGKLFRRMLITSSGHLLMNGDYILPSVNTFARSRYYLFGAANDFRDEGVDVKRNGCSLVLQGYDTTDGTPSGVSFAYYPHGYGYGTRGMLGMVTQDRQGTQLYGYFQFDQTEGRINFTGQHHNYSVNEDIDADLKGFIVVSTGTYRNQMNQCNECNKYKVTINESLPIVDLSKKEKDKSVFGVISDKDDDGTSVKSGNSGFVVLKEVHSVDRPLTINSLGEGAIWVCDINGPIENGDYISSSPIPGIGMNQKSDFLMNYTVAKSTMECQFQKEQVPRKKLRTVPTMIEKTHVKMVPKMIPKMVPKMIPKIVDIYENVMTPKLDSSLNIMYDNCGNIIMTELLDDSGNIVTQQKRTPDGAPVTGYAYDDDGNMIMIVETDICGNTIYTADVDDSGNMINIEAVDNSGNIIMTEQTDLSGGYVMETEYDENGNPIMVQAKYNDGRLKYDPVLTAKGDFIYDSLLDSSGNVMMTDKYEHKYIRVYTDKYVIYNDEELTSEFYRYDFDFSRGTTSQTMCIGNVYMMAFIGCTYHCG